jgi:hypothetical protein
VSNRPEISLLNAARYLGKTRSLFEWIEPCDILNRLAMSVMLDGPTSAADQKEERKHENNC